MSAWSQALGAESSPFTLTHNGRVYHVSLITQAVKTAYEKWLWGRAQDLAFSWRNKMASEEYSAHLKVLGDDYLNGEYDFTSEKAAKALKTIPGALALTAILFGVTEVEMVALTVERGPEIKELLSLVMRESLPSPSKPAEGEAPNV